MFTARSFVMIPFSTISTAMINEVKNNINVPLVVGGGIKTAEKAAELCNAGADVIVIGNVTEKNPEIISEIAAAIHSFHAS